MQMVLHFSGQCSDGVDVLNPPLAPAQCFVDPADLFPFRFMQIDEDANYALSPQKLKVYVCTE